MALSESAFERRFKCLNYRLGSLCRALHSVKGCRTPARARGKAATCTDLRAGVGQASREETAAHATVVVEGCVAMAIGAVRRWRSGSTTTSAVRGTPGNSDVEVRRRDKLDGLAASDRGCVWTGTSLHARRWTADVVERLD